MNQVPGARSLCALVYTGEESDHHRVLEIKHTSSFQVGLQIQANTSIEYRPECYTVPELPRTSFSLRDQSSILLHS
jgi:hypothetical protein